MTINRCSTWLAIVAALAVAACAQKGNSHLWVYDIDRSTAEALVDHCLPEAKRDVEDEDPIDTDVASMGWTQRVRSSEDFPLAWFRLRVTFTWRSVSQRDATSDRLWMINVTASRLTVEHHPEDSDRFRDLLICVLTYGNVPQVALSASLAALDELRPDFAAREPWQHASPGSDVRSHARGGFAISAGKRWDHQSQSVSVVLRTTAD